jgi:hypothetical protein
VVRIAIFSFILLAAPGLLAQTSGQTPSNPGDPMPSDSVFPGAAPVQISPGRSQLAQFLLQKQPSNLTAQSLTPPVGPSRSQLVAQNNGFSFVLPHPAAPVAKMEPIPTQWPNAKYEPIPTHWNNVRVVPIGNSAQQPANGAKIQR